MLLGVSCKAQIQILNWYVNLYLYLFFYIYKFNYNQYIQSHKYAAITKHSEEH